MEIIMAKKTEKSAGLCADIQRIFQDVAKENGFSLKLNSKSFSIYSEKWHSIEFLFQWQKDHFVGKFVSYNSKGEWKASQAIVSIWNYTNAIEFLNAFKILFDMPAKRKTK